MEKSLTRRQLLRTAGVGALGVTGLGLGTLFPARAQAAEPYPRLLWLYERLLIDRPSYTGDPTQQLLHVPVMHVADKLGHRYDDWYLWVWTHDAPICRLYTMPRPYGPVTNRGLCNLPPPPPGYDPTHFAAGDVVWDPVSRLFYSTPHGRTNTNSGQPTFLIKSSDGVNWSYVRSDPIVSPGNGTYDGYQTAYGRFLRDPWGNLRRVGGRALWFYRGERRDPQEYRVGLAVSTDMVNFSKHSPVPRFNPLNGALFSLGSALMVNGNTYLLLSAPLLGLLGGGSVKGGPSLMFLKQANVSGDPYQWSDGPGIPIFIDLRSLAYTDGGSYYIDPETGIHRFAYANVENITGPQRFAVHTAIAPLI